MTGCEKVPFTPSFQTSPQARAHTNSPSGFSVDLSLPQDLEPETIGESDLRSAVVRLPAGVRLSPSAARGLGACSSAQIALGSEAAPSCPEDSKIGTIGVQTPSLEEEMHGSVYVAAPHDNPFGSLLAIYMVIEGPGVTVKLAGHVQADPLTGQLTTVVEGIPQLPFSHMHLEFEGGPGAPLVMPSRCGAYTSDATLGGWNGKTVQTSSEFAIANGGSSCPASLPFAPVFAAGAAIPLAGAHTPFAVQLTRSDADQQFSSIGPLTLPPGLTGDPASVPVRCSDAQAAAAACPAASRVGNVTVGAGAGPDPFYIADGNAYLTGPYKGAPFGLAFVVHAAAGPFDLGMVVVRAQIQIDPRTAQARVVSDPLPTILQGIPLQLRDIRVTVDRPGFMINPTSCGEMQIAGTATSTEGASAELSSRFQVAGCRGLSFDPGFRVTTVAKTSRQIGAALHVTVTSGPGQANIRSVRVSLPKVLPSRLTTLQKACADSVFQADPAACPAASRVGTATAVTPILAARLSGPAYFVSHGGAKFPELTIVLQGEGVTVVLGGETFINGRTNVTSSSFRSVPDVPVTRFDLTLPQGRFSALAATADLCRGGLAMPTRIVGQNGAVVQRRTRIAVSGCPKGRRREKRRR